MNNSGVRMMRYNRAVGACGLVLGFSAIAIPVHAGTPTLRTTRISTNVDFSEPLYVTAPPGDFERIFVVEQRPSATGRIKILNLSDNSINATPFLTVSGVSTGNEQGLLGLAFHPDYANNGTFYVNYTTNIGGNRTRVVKYQVSANPDIADAGSAQIILTFTQPQSNHNGGWIGFGPNDGFLYIATGDGGNFCDTGGGHTAGGNSQDITNNLLGKMLRIDVDSASPFAIPPSNPFVGVTGDDEIWAFGLRNPFRSSFDRMTGDLYIGDVGQDAQEEVDFQPGGSAGGENYGWPCTEGSGCASASGCNTAACGGCGGAGQTLPIFQYTHSAPPGGGFVCAVTGGYVYRGCALPGLSGTYFFTDFCSNRIWTIKEVGGVATAFTDVTSQLSPSIEGAFVGSITSFGEDAAGEMYIVDRGGEIFRIITTDAPTADCNNNNIEDACDVFLGDCQPNGVPDECDITGGTSTDINGNLIPDECDTAPSRPLAENFFGVVCGGANPDDDCMGESFCVPDALGGFPGTCYVPKNRYLSLEANPNNAGVMTARRIAAVIDTANVVLGWIGPPVLTPLTGEPPVQVAAVQPTAHYMDWSTITETVHVAGCSVRPGDGVDPFRYVIQSIALGSDEAVEASFSPELGVRTVTRYGDSIGPVVDGQSSPPDEATNFLDIFATVVVFQNAGSATPRLWTDLVPDIPDATTNFADIFGGVVGFQTAGTGYPFILDPCACPDPCP